MHLLHTKKEDLEKVENPNWLYIDINSYFATIEQQIAPSLRNRPVIVVPVLSDSTCAIAASIEAKRKGIKTGTRVYEAKKLCPEVVCVVAKHKIYVEYHKRIFAEVDKHIYVDHILSIDEAACRLTGNQREWSAAIILAKKVKQAIRDNVGDYISCSIGIGPNRYLAKVATEMQKPDGLVVISKKDLPEKLYNLHLNELPGIGRKTLERLRKHGIASIRDLYILDAKYLRRIWGSIYGERMWYLIRGADLSPEESKTTSISHSRVLAPESRNHDSARMAVLSLTTRAAERLRKSGLYTSSVFLYLKTVGGVGGKEGRDAKNVAGISVSYKSSVKIPPSCDNHSLSEAVLKCWSDIMDRHNAASVKIIKVGVCFPKVEEESRQMEFGYISGNYAERIGNREADNQEAKLTIDKKAWTDREMIRKRQQLSRSMDALNAKYGRGTVTLGEIPEKTKEPVVAFGYIPEIPEASF